MERNKDPELRRVRRRKLDFLVGANWRMCEYGQNFGRTAWRSDDSKLQVIEVELREVLSEIADAGMNVLRVDLVADGRTLYDDKCRLVESSIVPFYEDVRFFLNLVAEFGIRVIFVILDRVVAGIHEVVDGVTIRGRQKLLTDGTTVSVFVDSFLIPFLNEFGYHESVLAFDVLNDAERIVSQSAGGLWESDESRMDVPEVPLKTVKSLRAYFKSCQGAIHTHSSKYCTIGCSARCFGLMENFRADFMSLNYYPWTGRIQDMVTAKGVLDVAKGRTKLGKVLISQYPLNHTDWGPERYLSEAKDNGLLGAIAWNLRPGEDKWCPATREERKVMIGKIGEWVAKNM